MRRSDEVVSWVPPLIGYGVWFVLLVVLRGVVLSMRGVQTAGFAIPPLSSELYMLGLYWIVLVDALLRTIILISILAFGGRLRGLIVSTTTRLDRLGNVAYLGSIAGAVAVGYYAYALIILPPLMYQGVEWAYDLVFRVALAGIGAAAVYETARLLTDFRRREEAIEPGPAPKSKSEVVTQGVCPACRQPTSRGDVFCRACGVRIHPQNDAGGRDEKR